VLLIVCEPTRESVLTAARTAARTAALAAALAAELSIAKVLVLGNKARSAEGETFLCQVLADEGITLACVLPYDADIAAADRRGRPGPHLGRPRRLLRPRYGRHDALGGSSRHLSELRWSRCRSVWLGVWRRFVGAALAVTCAGIATVFAFGRVLGSLHRLRVWPRRSVTTR
jgi:hypothetical protein